MTMKDTLGVLLAGGAGERLFPLTRDRAKPAVPFGGHYRIIDITLSNCINSGLRRVYILTQYKALSLNRHIREGWTGIVAQELGEFIEILPPMQRVSANWYMGTADAVYQNIYSIGAEQPKHVLILSGDHIYKMNYSKMLEHHKDTGADVTLATLPILPDEVKRFGVVEVSKTGEVIGFLEKPASTEAAVALQSGDGRRVDGHLHLQYRRAVAGADQGLGRPGIEARLRAQHPAGDLLGNTRFMPTTSSMRTRRRRFTGGTLERSMLTTTRTWMLSSVSPMFNLYDASWPMRTRVRQYPPAKFVFGEPGRTGMAINSTISAGCIVSGAVVRNSVLSQDVRVNSYSEVDSSIIFSHVDIGRHCRIKRAIIDRDVKIPEGTVIGYDPNEDKRNYFVTPSGLTVVARDYSLYESPVDSDFMNQPR